MLEFFQLLQDFSEHLSFLQTVGYGDIELVHKSSRQFTVAFIIVSTTLVALTIRTFSATLQEERQLELLEHRLRGLQSLRFNKDIPVSSGDYVLKSDIVLAMLCRTGVLNHATDIAPWLQVITEQQSFIYTGETVNFFLFSSFCLIEN